MATYLYRGVELPALPGWDGMPPAGVFILSDARDGTYVLCGLNAVPRCVLIDGENVIALPLDIFGTCFVTTEKAESWGAAKAFEPERYFVDTDGNYTRQRNVSFLWTHNDILTADGEEIYLHATAPVKVEEDSGITLEDLHRRYRRGYAAGLIIGRTCEGVLSSKKGKNATEMLGVASLDAASYATRNASETAGNYLYNGVELPPPPHWDGMPPFGEFILKLESESSYRLYGVNDDPFCVVVGGAEKIAFAADVIGSYFRAREGETQWFGGEPIDGNLADVADLVDGVFVLKSTAKLVWSRDDVYGANGTNVFFYGTEPVEIQLPEQYTEEDARCNWRRGLGFGLAIGMTAKEIAEGADVPVDAEYYLYGTPSESGNIALADGDGYVLYKGGALPPLPEWDKGKYPYAYMLYGHSFMHDYLDEIELYVTNKPCFLADSYGSDGVVRLEPKDGTTVDYIYYRYDGPPSTYKNWETGEEHKDSIFLATDWASAYIWTNHDLRREDGTLFLGHVIVRISPHRLRLSARMARSFAHTTFRYLPISQLRTTAAYMSEISCSRFRV